MGEEYIYVAVDETGNLGRSLKGERYYTVVACVVNDRRRFEDATRRLDYDEELKFQTHDSVREKVLRYAAPAVSEVFYVRYHKKGNLGRHEQSDLHLRMVQSLADTIVLRYGFKNELVVEVDHRDGVSDGMVRRAFENNEYRMNIVICDVLDSTESYGLQTNDFFVGAIGQMLNHADTRYVRMFDSKPVESYIRSYNRKQGEPASATRITGYTVDPSMMDSSPGIAAESPIPDEGRPVSRLDDESSRRHSTDGRKKAIESRNCRKQGEPASTQLVEYRPHGQSITDSPPGIAIQLRTPRAGYPMVRLDKETSEGYLRNSLKSKGLIGKRGRQGEPASTTPVEYRPHGQSIMDSPPGIAAEFLCKKGCPAVRLDNESSEGYLRNGRKNAIGSRNRRRQGEPASATPVEYRPHGQSIMDSPPGIAAEFLIPDEGRPAVRLDKRMSEGYLRNGQKSKGLIRKQRGRRERAPVIQAGSGSHRRSPKG